METRMLHSALGAYGVAWLDMTPEKRASLKRAGRRVCRQACAAVRQCMWETLVFGKPVSDFTHLGRIKLEDEK